MLFADGTILYLIINDLSKMTNNRNDDLDNLCKCLIDNSMVINETKSEWHHN